MTDSTANHADAIKALEDRRTWRAKRLEELRTELNALILEETLDFTKGSKLDLAGLKAECLEMKKQGHVVKAIKHYREHTGLGLRESKDAVEALS